MKAPTPIAQAPKDGSILLFHDGRDRYGCGFWNDHLKTWQFDEDTFCARDYPYLQFVPVDAIFGKAKTVMTAARKGSEV